MITRIKHDDGNLIWFDFNTINLKELDTKYNDIWWCDITNIPVTQCGRNILGQPKYMPNNIRLTNFMVTFYEDKHSTTGYSCMCMSKNKNACKSRAGYINGKPSSLNY